MSDFRRIWRYQPKGYYCTGWKPFDPAVPFDQRGWRQSFVTRIEDAVIPQRQEGYLSLRTYSEPNRRSPKGTRILGADNDAVDPRGVAIRPTLVVQTSDNDEPHYQSYYV